ncbi:DUF1178 family protein [Roseateles oligotrophus]|uniref:DUF1178 family protein n=1 Tax=Roseateles oligotrophus TaxID=1769250 RepID=A0ABT2YG46_9BURK|nr:DUF1178 family protein [Roseateles oligotrophus]MCV2368999.1 DUF1178 family protein [Roseateles oligotrophus]
MLVLNLCCGNDHRFEGWFGSAQDFESQVERTLIACPICTDHRVKRLPTAPHLNVSHIRAGTKAPEAIKATQAATSAPITAQAPQGELQRKMQEAVAQVLANTEDVGDRFAEEARRIHYGETAAHGIRGQASVAEVADLVEEGIAVLPLALPAAFKGQMQ